LFLQTGLLFATTGAPRVDIALEFPGKSLKHDLANGNLTATIGLLGKIDQSDGTPVTRFSDFTCCSSETETFAYVARPEDAGDFIPSRYETQIDLPPGRYSLHVVLSDGSRFGRVDAPLTVDPYDPKQLAISSVFLCKRFRDAAEAAPEAAARLAPEYLPLVSSGAQFTPAGDTRFTKDGSLFAYFQVYEPLLASAPSTAVQIRLRITDPKNGQVKVDTGFRNAADWIKPGSPVIHIAEKVDIGKLPAGPYQLEVQATDSAGRSTAWRSATFTVEGSKAFRLN
jgi:hypothetical protein